MRAYVTEDFPGRPDDEPQVRTIKKEEVISGDLAEIAVREGYAKEMSDADFEDFQEFERQQQAEAEAAAEADAAPAKGRKGKKPVAEDAA
jgi:hypothetical protein